MVTGWPDEQFEDFVAARLPALVGFAYGLTGVLGHSQDLVQTALLGVRTVPASRTGCS